MPDRSQPAVSSLVEDRASKVGRSIVALIEPRALIRDFVTRALVRGAGNLSVLAVAQPEDLQKLKLDGRDPAAIVLSIGDRKFLDAPVQDEIQRTSAISPNTPLVVLADREDVDQIFAALQRGLKGYLVTSTGLDLTLDAIRLVCTGGTFIPASSLQPLVEDHESKVVKQESIDDPGLTPREREVLDCVREGLANKAIAHKLKMSEGTAKVHVRRIMKKFHATNRTQVLQLTNHLFEGRRRQN
jgi:DNA-binding NarL/FixJ family response regulator